MPPTILLDTLARGGAIALLATLTAALLRDLPRSAVSWSAAGLFASIAAHLLLSSPIYDRGGLANDVLQAAALAAPAAFWLFTRTLFADERPPRGRDVTAAAVLVAVGLFRPAREAQVLYYLMAVVLVAAALTEIWRERPGDLVEPRRRLRAVFVGVVGLEFLTVLAVEVGLQGQPAPASIELMKSAAALGITALFTVWLLTARPDLLAPAPSEGAPAGAGIGPGDVDARYRDRLLAAMRDDRLYRQEGLTIGALAARLDLPEYRVRRIINQHLGYRNFNAFLNDLRTDEACRILADPAHERLPIFNLALDLGYGSPGPFNRAFRAKTGMTPSEFRRARTVANS
ncbi:MAG: AraC family transcriptional regulator [Acidobacteriota bacterium]